MVKTLQPPKEYKDIDTAVRELGQLWVLQAINRVL